MAGLIPPTHILELYLKSVVKVHLTMHLSTSLQSQSASSICDASNNRCVDACSGRGSLPEKWRGSVRKRRVRVVELGTNRRRHLEWVRFVELRRPRVQTHTPECSSRSSAEVHCGSTVDLHPLLSSRSWLSFWVSSGGCWLSGKPLYLLLVSCRFNGHVQQQGPNLV